MNLLIALGVKPMKKTDFGDSFKRSEAVLTAHTERRNFCDRVGGAPVKAPRPPTPPDVRFRIRRFKSSLRHNAAESAVKQLRSTTLPSVASCLD